MIYLLDVNLLIAMGDSFHAHYQLAHQWFAAISRRKWATCPITQNGFLRITSSASYPGGHGSLSSQQGYLRQACDQPAHHFWPDDLSLLDETIWSEPRLVNSRHITDLYLLALAVKHKGKLATFDRNIPVSLIVDGQGALEIVG